MNATELRQPQVAHRRQTLMMIAADLGLSPAAANLAATAPVRAVPRHAHAAVHSVGVESAAPDEIELGNQLRSLYDQHYRSLVKMAAFYLDDIGSCEETVQDAFVSLLSAKRTVQAGREGAYLRSAVLNGARSALRKRKVRREKKPEASGPTGSPEVTALEAVVRSDVLAAIRTLPKRQADIVVLRYYLDLSEAEIADTLGLARGTVKSHSHRALAKLSSLLEDLQ